MISIAFVFSGCANLGLEGQSDPAGFSSEPSPEESRGTTKQRCLINGEKTDCDAWLSVASDEEISNEPIMFLEKLCPNYGHRVCILLGNKNVEIGYFADAKKAFDLGCKLKSKDACKKTSALKDHAKNEALFKNTEKECIAGTASACRAAYRLKYRVDKKAALGFLDLACGNEDMESCRILAKESIKSEDQETAIRAFKILCAREVPQACSNYFEMMKISEQKTENEKTQEYRETILEQNRMANEKAQEHRNAILEQNRIAEKRAQQVEYEARRKNLFEKNRRKCTSEKTWGGGTETVCEDMN